MSLRDVEAAVAKLVGIAAGDCFVAAETGLRMFGVTSCELRGRLARRNGVGIWWRI